MVELQGPYKMKKQNYKILNKKFSRPITCLTAYSPAVAKILDGLVDIILVGDSLGSTLYGMQNSRGVTLEMMKRHGLAVTKNVKKSITMIDMPFNTYKNKIQALKNAKKLLEFTKSKILKVEINKKNLSIVRYLVEKNFNIVAHIGVTPQSYTNFNKIKAVGKVKEESENLLYIAKELEKAGALALLLECINQKTAKNITNSVSIPTIGIGSSKYCDGQVLVFDDLVNFENTVLKPKFVKKYADLNKLSKSAVIKFCKEVKQKNSQIKDIPITKLYSEIFLSQYHTSLMNQCLYQTKVRIFLILYLI